MARYTLDLIFDEHSGDVKVVVDFHDPSLTPLEINEAIRDGEIRKELLGIVSRVLGEEVADRVERGETEMVCLDDHPELRPRSGEEAKDPEDTSQRTGRELEQ